MRVRPSRRRGRDSPDSRVRSVSCRRRTAKRSRDDAPASDVSCQPLAERLGHHECGRPATAVLADRPARAAGRGRAARRRKQLSLPQQCHRRSWDAGAANRLPGACGAARVRVAARERWARALQALTLRCLSPRRRAAGCSQLGSRSCSRRSLRSAPLTLSRRCSSIERGWRKRRSYARRRRAARLYRPHARRPTGRTCWSWSYWLG